VRDIAAAKEHGERWPMLTSYDALTARIFDEAGVPVLLVGDSAANVVYGYDTTIPVTMDELVPLVRAVSRASKRAMVVADMPFASYQASPAQALDQAARFMKEGFAHAVKLEGGSRVLPQVEALVAAGIPVMAHLGLTPQSVNVLGGYRVQGRGEAGERLMQDAKALQEAGAFALVPGSCRPSWPAGSASRQSRRSASAPARHVTRRSWSGRMAGLTPSPGPKFEAVRRPAQSAVRCGAPVRRRVVGGYRRGHSYTNRLPQPTPPTAAHLTRHLPRTHGVKVPFSVRGELDPPDYGVMEWSHSRTESPPCRTRIVRWSRPPLGLPLSRGLAIAAVPSLLRRQAGSRWRHRSRPGLSAQPVQSLGVSR
jgi:hypothetical protein